MSSQHISPGELIVGTTSGIRFATETDRRILVERIDQRVAEERRRAIAAYDHPALQQLRALTDNDIELLRQYMPEDLRLRIARVLEIGDRR